MYSLTRVMSLLHSSIIPLQPLSSLMEWWFWILVLTVPRSYHVQAFIKAVAINLTCYCCNCCFPENFQRIYNREFLAYLSPNTPVEDLAFIVALILGLNRKIHRLWLYAQCILHKKTGNNQKLTSLSLRLRRNLICCWGEVINVATLGFNKEAPWKYDNRATMLPSCTIPGCALKKMSKSLW